MFGSGNDNSGSIFGGGSSKDKGGSIFNNDKNDKGAGSIFGGGLNNSGGSVFDSKKDSKSGMFDTKGNQSTEGISGVFGAKKETQDTGSIFGSGKDNKNSGSIFGEVKDSHDAKTNGSIFGGGKDNKNSGSVFGEVKDSQGAGSVFGGGSEDNTSSMFGGSPTEEGSSTQSIFGGSHSSDRVDARGLDIRDDDKYGATYLSEDRGLSDLNVRGGNYGGQSVLDRMRGLQANHLNNDTGSVSLAEQYSDGALDKRAMGGLYNTTLVDIYADKTKYAAHHGLMTDGIVDIKDNLYQVDTATDDNIEQGGFWGTNNTGENALNFGEAGGPIHELYKKDAKSVNQSIFNNDKTELSNMNKIIAATANEKALKKEKARKEKDESYFDKMIGKNKKDIKEVKKDVFNPNSFLADGMAENFNDNASKYEDIRKENEEKKKQKRKEKDEAYFNKIINLNPEEENQALPKEEGRLNELAITNKSRTEFDTKKNLEKLFEKNINNVIIIIAIEGNTFKIGNKESFLTQNMLNFELKDNSWYKIGEYALHLKYKDDDIYCNIGRRLPDYNNEFPFEFIMKDEAILTKIKQVSIEINRINNRKNNKKDSVKNILSMISD